MENINLDNCIITSLPVEEPVPERKRDFNSAFPNEDSSKGKRTRKKQQEQSSSNKIVIPVSESSDRKPKKSKPKEERKYETPDVGKKNVARHDEQP